MKIRVFSGLALAFTAFMSPAMGQISNCRGIQSVMPVGSDEEKKLQQPVIWIKLSPGLIETWVDLQDKHYADIKEIPATPSTNARHSSTTIPADLTGVKSVATQLNGTYGTNPITIFLENGIPVGSSTARTQLGPRKLVCG